MWTRWQKAFCLLVLGWFLSILLEWFLCMPLHVLIYLLSKSMWRDAQSHSIFVHYTVHFIHIHGLISILSRIFCFSQAAPWAAQEIYRNIQQGCVHSRLLLEPPNISKEQPTPANKQLCKYPCGSIQLVGRPESVDWNQQAYRAW